MLPLWVFTRRVLLASAVIAAAGRRGAARPDHLRADLRADACSGTGPLVAGFALATLTIGWPISAALSGRFYLRLGFRTTALIGSVLVVIGALSDHACSAPARRSGRSPRCCFVVGARHGPGRQPDPDRRAVAASAGPSAAWSPRTTCSPGPSAAPSGSPCSAPSPTRRLGVAAEAAVNPPAVADGDPRRFRRHRWVGGRACSSPRGCCPAERPARRSRGRRRRRIRSTSAMSVTNPTRAGADVRQQVGGRSVGRLPARHRGSSSGRCPRWITAAEPTPRSVPSACPDRQPAGPVAGPGERARHPAVRLPGSPPRAGRDRRRSAAAPARSVRWTRSEGTRAVRPCRRIAGLGAVDDLDGQRADRADRQRLPQRWPGSARN